VSLGKLSRSSSGIRTYLCDILSFRRQVGRQPQYVARQSLSVVASQPHDGDAPDGPPNCNPPCMVADRPSDLVELGELQPLRNVLDGARKERRRRAQRPGLSVVPLEDVDQMLARCVEEQLETGRLSHCLQRMPQAEPITGCPGCARAPAQSRCDATRLASLRRCLPGLPDFDAPSSRHGNGATREALALQLRSCRCGPNRRTRLRLEIAGSGVATSVVKKRIVSSAWLKGSITLWSSAILCAAATCRCTIGSDPAPASPYPRSGSTCGGCPASAQAQEGSPAQEPADRGR
jgi:hypothetical protein